MKKKWCAVFAAMALATAAFAENFPEYLVVIDKVLCAYKDALPADLVIPEGITEIGENAFMNCSKLESVVIPASVTKIGKYAFFDSTIVSVTIPASVKRIEEESFGACKKLASVTIPNSVTSIGDGAFDGCTKLTSVTIPNSVTSIGKFAFNGCIDLVNLELPASVKSIGQQAFSESYRLEEVKYAGTKAQWGAIKMGLFVIGTLISKVIIHCSDGDIFLK